MMKKIPERKCMGCMNSFPKQELVRIVKNKEGEISLDTTGKKAGRGAYICKSADCLKKAVKARRLEKSFECAIPDSILAELEEALKNVSKAE
ncbi:MAG: YlxR family protein [Clostridia bacterium]|nr:YlxR family protein [Clostridia bacterium]